MASRKESINRRLEELHDLLDQWGDYRTTARDPNEVLKSNKEIAKIKSYITEYEQELAGEREEFIEDKQHPITKPEIAKINRKWITGIIASLLVFLLAFVGYNYATAVNPDYDKYLAFIQEGDKLLEAKAFVEAQASYEQALEYFPGDSAVTNKLDLLKKANRLIEQEEFKEAEEVFELVLKIPLSDNQYFQAQFGNSVATEPSANNASITLTLKWQGNSLVITVSGGTPFSTNNEPYKIDGIACKDCLQWTTPKPGVYQATVERNKVTVELLAIQDSKGNSTRQRVPSYGANSSSTSGDEDTLNSDTPEPLVDDETREQEFQGLVNSGDEYFAEENFTKAKEQYLSAQRIKANDPHVKSQLKKCDEKIREKAIAEAKEIPSVSLTGGSFMMGDEEGFPDERPVHEVQLSGFRMSKNEVTVKQYRAFCELTGRQMPPAPSFGYKDNLPMTNVTWHEANAFCKWVGGRLPTEAEWEYAARDGGGAARYSGGNVLSRLAVYDGNSGGQPMAVGSKSANSSGIRDLTGNVSEWCSDWYYRKYPSESQQNPRGPGSGTDKIIRGGGFNSSPNSTMDGDQLRNTYRNHRKPDTRSASVGFRVAW